MTLTSMMTLIHSDTTLQTYCPRPLLARGFVEIFVGFFFGPQVTCRFPKTSLFLKRSLWTGVVAPEFVELTENTNHEVQL